MNYKYGELLDSTIYGNSGETYEDNKVTSTNDSNINLNNIYAKIVKLRKELEKSYNLFYSYNLIVGNRNEENVENNNYTNSYSNIYKRNEGNISSYKNSKDNLTLNKINALTNSFFMNVEILKNSYSFLKENNNKMINNESVIWEKRIETLTKESSSYIKTLDNIYKTNLNQSELNKKQHGYKSIKKKTADDEISYLNKEQEILKQVEENINVFQMQGMNTLQMLRKQNKFLKNVQKKIIDMYNYVGFSSVTIDSIKKTHTQNLYIVIFGIIATIIFFYFMYTTFKR